MLARWCNAPIFLHPFRFLFRTTCTAGSSFDGVQLLNIQVQNKVRTATQTTPPTPPTQKPTTTTHLRHPRPRQWANSNIHGLRIYFFDKCTASYQKKFVNSHCARCGIGTHMLGRPSLGKTCIQKTRRWGHCRCRPRSRFHTIIFLQTIHPCPLNPRRLGHGRS